jgi:hypothetical protein
VVDIVAPADALAERIAAFCTPRARRQPRPAPGEQAPSNGSSCCCATAAATTSPLQAEHPAPAHRAAHGLLQIAAIADYVGYLRDNPRSSTCCSRSS